MSKNAANSLVELLPIIARQEGFSDVIQALRARESVTIDGAWGSAAPLVAASLSREFFLESGTIQQGSPSIGKLLIVIARKSDSDVWVSDLEACTGSAPQVLPTIDSLGDDRRTVETVVQSRIQLTRMMANPKQGGIVVAPIASLLQPCPTKEEIAARSRTFVRGELLDPEELLKWLVAQGFERVTAVELPGEFSRKGGVVDIFFLGEEDPLRFEFFGEEIESIRRFDASTQRRLEEIEAATVTLLKAGGETETGEMITWGSSQFIDHVPSDWLVVLHELADLEEEGRHFLGRLDHPRGFFSTSSVLQRCILRPTVSITAMPVKTYETACHLRLESVERLTGHGKDALRDLASILTPGDQVLLACHNEGERARLQELITEHEGDEQNPTTNLSERVQLCLGRITRGFRLVREHLVVLSDHELFSRRAARQVTRKRVAEARAIDSFLELSEGDLVVHLTHGIGRFRGMQLLAKGAQVEEHIEIEFRDGVRIFVPTSLIHLVQKYVGGQKTAPQLSKIGSLAWDRKKKAVAEAVLDMASDLVQLQAARAHKPGIAFPPDSHWQEEFEQAFPYQETDDQLKAIGAVKTDMQNPRPMDRLICGDVGYGKTEVAIRAAFKAIDAGKQVALLVPTTVLAEQHFRSFSERMVEFPFRVDVISRFKTRREQQETLESLAVGQLDVIIGTHRLVQPDVKFHDLGLLIIDEEQRFGVDAKETLKRLRLEVDVLTLSATPIPRTLHLSLLGIRDISNLETPPHDRQAIETRICRFDTDLIRQGIVRELNRGGQVYFVHNKVYNIGTIADRLQSIVPEARIDVVHGQLSGDSLEEAMRRFVMGETDILVATTIIESGLDIPNANTIYIHEADHYGLADLHQLRGRVGRYKHRAYCYLILEEGKVLTEQASKRLKAIEEYSELGAGFRIAMRDLEIRGAGNILGTEQSGHIAAVGYELYCQLLERAAKQLKKEPIRELKHVSIDLPIPAFFPGSYVPPGRMKIEVYRKLSRLTSLEEVEAFRQELRDRFGPLPLEASRLLALRDLQVLAQKWQVDGIYLEAGEIVLLYRSAKVIQPIVDRTARRLRIIDERKAYFLLDVSKMEAEELIETVKTLLQAT